NLQLSCTLFDGAGNISGVSDPLDNLTTFIYDGLYRQTKVISPLFFSGETRYLDKLGRLVEQEDAEGVVTRTEHDGLGRLAGMFENYISGQSGSDVSVETRYAYDTLGRLDTITLPGGSAVDYGYDNLNRRTTVDGLREGSLDTWETAYDAAGRL